MNTYALSPARLFVVVAFALSCFGILLYLWSAFGGNMPLRPHGYRVTVGLPESELLTANADVRISGVSVGRVSSTKHLGVDANRKDVVIEVDSRYAPLPRNVKATIRRKSIGGEMYVELTPGERRTGLIPDGGRIDAATVAPSVELDEVFRAFDPRTRQRLRTWFRQQAVAIDGRGRDLSDALGNAGPLEQDATALLRIVNGQDRAVREAVRGTAEVFDALARRTDALQGLITDGERATDAFARRSDAFAGVWRALPSFELESRRLLARADSFARKADPVVSELRPAWRALAPLAADAEPAARELAGLVRGVDGAERASRRGLPAAREFVEELGPLVKELSPFLRQLAPIVQHLFDYRDNVGMWFANVVAITNAVTPGFGADDVPIHYARASVLLTPEGLALHPSGRRLPTNRANPYALPRAQITKDAPVPVFDDRACGPDVFPTLAGAGVDAALLANVKEFVLNDGEGTAPPCVLQQRPGGGDRYVRLQPLSPTRGGGGTP